MNKVLITGASGFIGRHLVPALNSRDAYQLLTLTSSCGNVADPETFSSLTDVDVVVHLAARTFVPDSWANPNNFFQTNLLGTLQVLEYCRRLKARIVYISSYVYGNPKSLPISESAEVDARNPYMLSKLMAEDACRFYARTYNIQTTILRPFNIFGSGQDKCFLIPQIISQVVCGEKVTVQDVSPRRDYLYVDDLVSAIVNSIECPFAFEVFNIGSGSSYSVTEVIETIMTAIGKKVPVECGQNIRPNEVAETVADITKAKTMLFWRPQWSFYDAIKHMVSEEQK